ncbi:MAG: hypothetical protein ACLQIB_47565 [Isosphaeraceae bacterium]
MWISAMRFPARLMLRRILAAVLCGAASTANLGADEPPRPPTGEVRLAGGRVVDYTIHFDRNSLQDSVRLGNRLVGLTSSGAFLRFDLPAVLLVRERIGFEDSGRNEGDVAQPPRPARRFRRLCRAEHVRGAPLL